MEQRFVHGANASKLIDRGNSSAFIIGMQTRDCELGNRQKVRASSGIVGPLGSRLCSALFLIFVQL
eukprot:3836625-Alexandrium_andersonii.AAC.1